MINVKGHVSANVWRTSSVRNVIVSSVIMTASSIVNVRRSTTDCSLKPSVRLALGSERLHRDIANSPRFSRRGTPTSNPAADTRAADDRPKPAPRKTPTKAYPTDPYQAADRHPGSAEPSPPTPVTCRCTQNPRVPARSLLTP